MIKRTRLTGFVGTAAVVALAASMAPSPAHAAVATATLAEKAAALNTLGIPPEPKFTGQKDCDLTISIWEELDGQANRKEVRAAAVNAFASPVVLQQGDTTPCTLFIRTDVFAAKQRDVANELAVQEQERVERELKQKAALTIGLTVSTDDLGLTVKNFVDLVRKSDKAGPRVKAGAQTAYDGSAADQLAFLGDGIVAAHEADREEQIRIDTQHDEALRRKLIEEAARKRALAVLLVDATDGMLAASDRDFITYIWENAAQGTEVRGAAERAVLSREPADWNAYIHTGIHEAREADRQAAIRKKYEADVAKADAIVAEATKNGHHNLAHATRKALAGSATELDQFLRVGQFDLDLITGFEAGEVGLTWTNTAVPGSPVNVDNCLPMQSRLLSAQVTTANAQVNKAEADLTFLQMEISAATTAAEKARLTAKLPAARKAITDAKAAHAKAKATYDACLAKAPEAALSTTKARTGTNALQIVGNDRNATRSYAYFQTMNLDRVMVGENTVLSYWIFPSAGDWLPSDSSCVAVDLIFSNGANLRDSGAVDQNGNRAHPAQQCGKLKANEWNQVTVPLGKLFNGRAVTRLDVAYDQAAETGAFRAYIDDISITG
ncbi:hypothetical protein Q0Z83_098810 [Actinoplanes sichuanensis]|uniref:Uncharacterized protein n=1 Tax=Actinoplanes sichuanensis TaxID=512349 RepID=A0ABW4AA49_9ACTN|nr:hypothetical protein [Actinoplanes sichuanensis]BEL11690.1 hypothetical protein Q0Z83_098810 [Actinoplanes sichuanensis]